MIPKERTSRAVVNHLDSMERAWVQFPAVKEKERKNEQRSYNSKRCRLKNRYRLDYKLLVSGVPDWSLHRLAYFSALLGSG